MHGGFDHADLAAIVGTVITASATIVVALIISHRSSIRTMETGNGKKLGETVHDMFQLQESTAAQFHQDLAAIADRLEAHIAQAHVPKEE